MAIRTQEEILNLIKGKLNDDTSDEALALIEDVTDTLTDLETRTKNSDEWKTKYETNDKEWRERYKARFFNEPVEDESEILEKKVEIEEHPKTFEDLFKAE
jgi:hypothetical protein